MTVSGDGKGHDEPIAATVPEQHSKKPLPGESYEDWQGYLRTRLFFRMAFREHRDPEFELEDYEPTTTGDGYHPPSTFTVAGRRWRCTWKRDPHYNSFQDRAHWDDGWWPTFETPAVKRRLRPQRWVSLWGRVGEAVVEGLIPSV